jgi:predicted nucleic acid-binding protein
MFENKVFFDTNVLLYLTGEVGPRSARSEDLLADGGVISVQVLNEFVSNALGKFKLSWAETRLFLDTFRATLEIVPLTEDTHERGIEYAERHKLHIYDGMIVAAAALAGCTTLYSEDMHDGLTIDGVTVRNPYKS